MTELTLTNITNISNIGTTSYTLAKHLLKFLALLVSQTNSLIVDNTKHLMDMEKIA